MGKWNAHQCRFILLYLITIATSSIDASDQTLNGGLRVLLGFKEKPRGSNITFDCSPSGACVPCLYSEKGDEKYRCSETGYRIPLKCVEIKDNVRDGNEKKSQNGRSAMEISHNVDKEGRLLDEASMLEDGSQAYITYRSCIPPMNEEKLSVFGFESVVLGLLLLSGSFVYLRRKQTVTMPGVGGGGSRIQMTSRF